MNYDLEFGLVQEHDEFDLSITYLQTLGPNLFESVLRLFYNQFMYQNMKILQESGLESVVYIGER